MSLQLCSKYRNSRSQLLDTIGVNVPNYANTTDHSGTNLVYEDQEKVSENIVHTGIRVCTSIRKEELPSYIPLFPSVAK